MSHLCKKARLLRPTGIEKDVVTCLNKGNAASERFGVAYMQCLTLLNVEVFVVVIFRMLSRDHSIRQRRPLLPALRRAKAFQPEAPNHEFRLSYFSRVARCFTEQSTPKVGLHVCSSALSGRGSRDHRGLGSANAREHEEGTQQMKEELKPRFPPVLSWGPLLTHAVEDLL